MKLNKDGLTEEQFLANYKPGDYERPSVTVDMMVLRMDENLNSLKVLLIKRKDHPFIDNWALPGGFIGIRESAYEAACRELKEETGVTGVYLEQLYTMSKPRRDPRMRVISVSYMALMPYGSDISVSAGDDAKDAQWFDISFTDSCLKLSNQKDVHIGYNLKKHVLQNGLTPVKDYRYDQVGTQALAFDHAGIIIKGLGRLKNKLEYSDVAFNLVPEEFTLPDLQHVYEIILGKQLYSANFRDKMAEKISPADKKAKPISGRRISNLYKYRGEHIWSTE